MWDRPYLLLGGLVVQLPGNLKSTESTPQPMEKGPDCPRYFAMEPDVVADAWTLVHHAGLGGLTP